MIFIDTHAHLDDPVFDNDRMEVIARASQAGVSRVINVGYTPERWRTTVDLATTFSAIVPILGLHPHHADEFTDSTMEELRHMLLASRACALGEIGLDYFRKGPSAVNQRKSFTAQMQLAHSLGLPVVIHQRAAENDLMRELSYSSISAKVLLHSFEGSQCLVDMTLERGYQFGVGGLMTRASSGDLRDVLRGLPLNRMVLETDSPYLVPRGSKGRRNEPSATPTIGAALANLLGIDVEQVASQTTANAQTFFGAALTCGEHRESIAAN